MSHNVGFMTYPEDTRVELYFALRLGIYHLAFVICHLFIIIYSSVGWPMSKIALPQKTRSHSPTYRLMTNGK